MYPSVPTTPAVLVLSPDPWILARPKSVIRATSPRASMMFAGLMSRCTIPRRCASARPSATCRATARVSSIGSGPAARRSRRLRPSMYAIAMYARPSDSSAWSTVQTFGLSSAAAACASRRNRARAPGSAASSADRNLRATGRFSLTSSASQTTPMPPRPSSRTRRYRPAKRPCGFPAGSCVSGRPAGGRTLVASSEADQPHDEHARLPPGKSRWQAGQFTRSLLGGVRRNGSRRADHTPIRSAHPQLR